MASVDRCRNRRRGRVLLGRVGRARFVRAAESNDALSRAGGRHGYVTRPGGGVSRRRPPRILGPLRLGHRGETADWGADRRYCRGEPFRDSARKASANCIVRLPLVPWRAALLEKHILIRASKSRPPMAKRGTTAGKCIPWLNCRNRRPQH